MLLVGAPHANAGLRLDDTDSVPTAFPTCEEAPALIFEWTLYGGRGQTRRDPRAGAQRARGAKQGECHQPDTRLSTEGRDEGREVGVHDDTV